MSSSQPNFHWNSSSALDDEFTSTHGVKRADTHTPAPFTYSLTKRTLDFALASIGILLLLPLLLIVALLIKPNNRTGYLQTTAQRP